MVLGYARVSTKDQTLDGQRDALGAAGADRIFADTVTGTARSRPELNMVEDFPENASEAECKRARELDKEVLSQRQSSDYGALSSWDLTLQK